MSRWIDADALKEFIDDCGICAICPQKVPRCSYDCDFPDVVTEKWNLAIDAQPAIDAVSEWIPCSERLPSESGRYLCTCAEIQCGEYISCVDFGSFINGEWYTSGVIAWMPLPKPYGERECE